MAKIRSFEDLEVWQDSKQLAVDIIRAWNKIDNRGYFSLKDQMQRSAISVPSNIAEGSERKSVAEYLRFLYISKGSIAELRTQLIITSNLGLFRDELVSGFLEEALIISKRIGALISSIKR